MQKAIWPPGGCEHDTFMTSYDFTMVPVEGHEEKVTNNLG